MSNEKNIQPQTQHVIASEAQIKAYLHPLRMRLMSLLAERKITISQAAKEFDVHPANITHHFKLLEKVGLLKMVERRDIGRNVEKYYRAIARHFEVRAKKDELHGANATALNILRHDLAVAQDQLKGDDSEELLCLLWNAGIDSAKFYTFSRKLEQLLATYQAKGTGQGKSYSLCLGLYPCESDYRATGQIKIKQL